MSVNYKRKNHNKKNTFLARTSINCEWQKKNHKKYTLNPQKYKLWMEKQKWIKVCFAELCNDFILLKIANFHKYVGSLANEITRWSQTRMSERQKKRGHTKESIKTLTYIAQSLPVSWTTFGHIGFPSRPKRLWTSSMFTKWVFKVFAARMLLVSCTISRRVDFPSKVKGLSFRYFHKVHLWNACHQNLLTICGSADTQVGP